ncbi:MAG: hypothetical protein JXX14_07010 [Deltaproteobacteria bacterium]|nr:hypothetical protein [Deltaproteobacteria bacterium]
MNQLIEKRRATNICRQIFGTLLLAGFMAIASGCDQDGAGTGADKTDEAAERLAYRKVFNERFNNLPDAPYMTPCVVSKQTHELPAGSFYEGRPPFFGDNGTVYVLNNEDNTLAFNNEAGEWAWKQTLPFDASGIVGPHVRVLESGIVFSTDTDDTLFLTRYNQDGEMAFSMNLNERLSLPAGFQPLMRLMEEAPNGNMVVVISILVPCQNRCEMYRDAIEFRGDFTLEGWIDYSNTHPMVLASISPEGDVAWQQDYMDGYYSPTQLTVRRDGSSMLTVSTTVPKTNSVVLFLNNQGKLVREFPFLQIKPPMDDNTIFVYEGINAGTMEAGDGTLYVVGAGQGDLTATDATGKKVTFSNTPQIGDPFFIFQLNENLEINWSMYDTFAGPGDLFNSRSGLVYLTPDDFKLVNNDRIAVTGSVFAATAINFDTKSGVKLGSAKSDFTMFWIEYNSRGEFLWAQQLSPIDNDGRKQIHTLFYEPAWDSIDDLLNKGVPNYTSYNVSNDNRLNAVVYDSRAATTLGGEAYQYPSFSADASFCPAD